jgi:tetratricopeptide (TPR) repeat protein
MRQLLFRSVISVLGSAPRKADKEEMNYEELLRNCDALIKTGKISEVTEVIRGLNLSQVPRKYRQPFGKICRRSGLVEFGLRLLHPIIRHEKLLETPASSAEICEYAVLLSRNGSIQEALVLLGSVNFEAAPEALLYQGFCHVSNWNYRQAATDFERFLASQADSYSKLIARVNLTAAYIANGQLDLADHLLNEAIPIAHEHRALRLVGNCHELRAQVSFFKGDFAQARLELERSLEVFSESGSYDQLLIHKWQATMVAMETRSLEALSRFGEEALQKKHWESVRDTDFYRLKIEYNQKAFDHLIFGTPSQFYCDRVQNELNRRPSEFYIFGNEAGQIFDLQTGRLAESDEISGTKIHQAISALLRDFYAPRNIGQLFAEIYPNDYFDIESSPNKVRQVLRRTRRWMEANLIPAEILEKKGSYQLVIRGDFGIRIPLQRDAFNTMSSQWQNLKVAFERNDKFTAEEVCRKLKISRSSFHRLSVWALENRFIKKTGSNKATVYEFEHEKTRKVA